MRGAAASLKKSRAKPDSTHRSKKDNRSPGRAEARCRGECRKRNEGTKAKAGRFLGREPINLQGRRHARVRYASIADVLLHSSATTLCANKRRVRSADDLSASTGSRRYVALGLRARR